MPCCSALEPTRSGNQLAALEAAQGRAAQELALRQLAAAPTFGEWLCLSSSSSCSSSSNRPQGSSSVELCADRSCWCAAPDAAAGGVGGREPAGGRREQRKLHMSVSDPRAFEARLGTCNNTGARAAPLLSRPRP